MQRKPLKVKIMNLKESVNYKLHTKPIEIVQDKKNEAKELVIMYAKDIVELWPNITIRTLWKMTDKVNSLKEALKQAL